LTGWESEKMGLKGLQGSGLEIRCYIEGFIILKAKRRGVAFSNMVVSMLRLVWEGGYICTSWAQGRTPDCLVAVRRWQGIRIETLC
jgi:hypothetical protein